MFQIEALWSIEKHILFQHIQTSSWCQATRGTSEYGVVFRHKKEVLLCSSVFVQKVHQNASYIQLFIPHEPSYSSNRKILDSICNPCTPFLHNWSYYEPSCTKRETDQLENSEGTLFSEIRFAASKSRQIINLVRLVIRQRAMLILQICLNYPCVPEDSTDNVIDMPACEIATVRGRSLMDKLNMRS